MAFTENKSQNRKQFWNRTAELSNMEVDIDVKPCCDAQNFSIVYIADKENQQVNFQQLLKDDLDVGLDIDLEDTDNESTSVNSDAITVDSEDEENQPADNYSLYDYEDEKIFTVQHTLKCHGKQMFRQQLNSDIQDRKLKTWMKKFTDWESNYQKTMVELDKNMMEKLDSVDNKVDELKTVTDDTLEDIAIVCDKLNDDRIQLEARVESQLLLLKNQVELCDARWRDVERQLRESTSVANTAIITRSSSRESYLNNDRDANEADASSEGDDDSDDDQVAMPRLNPETPQLVEKANQKKSQSRHSHQIKMNTRKSQPGIERSVCSFNRSTQVRDQPRPTPFLVRLLHQYQPLSTTLSTSMSKSMTFSRGQSDTRASISSTRDPDPNRKNCEYCNKNLSKNYLPIHLKKHCKGARVSNASLRRVFRRRSNGDFSIDV